MLARPFARANRIRNCMIVASFGGYVAETVTFFDEEKIEIKEDM